MKDRQLYSHLKEESWRRNLTPAEQQQLEGILAGDAEAQREWEAETALNRALTTLPDVSLSSNFTARAVQAATAAEKVASRPWFSWNFRPRWLPRVAFAAFVLSVGMLSYVQVHNAERNRLLRSVTTVVEAGSLPGPEVLQDFEAIRALKTSAGADEELLRLLQ